MRKSPSLVILLIAAGAFAFPRPALAIDLSGPIVCALTDVFDCSGDDCNEVEAEAVQIPDLLRLDPQARTLTALDVELSGAGSKLDSITDEKGKIGVRAHESDRSLVLVIDDANGDAFFSVTDLHLALIAYGTCARP